MTRAPKTLLAVFFLMLPFFAFSQKWERKESKINKALEDGKYRKANRKAIRLETKAIKKLGLFNEHVPFARKTKAIYALQEGSWEDFENNTNYMLAVSDSIFKKGSPQRANYQFQYAKLWSKVGFAKKAYDTLQLAKSYQTRDEQPHRQASIVNLEARLLLEMGQYTQSLQLIHDEDDFMSTYGKGNNKKKEKKAALYQLADFMNLSAKAWLEKGDFAKADAVLKKSEALFKKSLAKNAWPKVEHARLKARLLENANDTKGALKYYNTAYKLSVKKRKIEDKEIIPYRETLLEAYFRLGKTKDGKKLAKKYSEISNKAFKRKSFHRLEVAYVEGISSFYEGKNKSAEKELQSIIEDNSLLPDAHPLKLKAKDLLYTLYIKEKKVALALSNLQEQLEIASFLYGKEGVRFHEKEMLRAVHLFDYTDELKEVGRIIANSFDSFLRTELLPQHAKFVSMQNQLIDYYTSIDDYNKALEVMEKSIAAARMKANNNALYGQQLVRYADLLFLKGDFLQSQNYLAAAKKILTPMRTQSENAQAYAEIMFLEARMFGQQGDFDLAEKTLNNATKFLRRQKVDKDIPNIHFSNLLAEVYQNSGQYAEAERLLTESIKQVEKMYGLNNRRALKARLMLGQLKLAQGDYPKATQIADQVEEKAKSLFGNGSLKAAAANLLKADIGAALGDYEIAAKKMEEGLIIYETVLGKNHLQGALIKANLALALLNGNIDPTRAAALLEEAMLVTEQQLGEENPTYANLLTYAAYIAISAKQYPKAFEKLSAAEKIWVAKVGKKNNANAATINALLGDVFYNLLDYKKAKQHYQKATKLYDRYFNDSHPDYVKTLAKISRVEYMEGNEKKAISLIETVLDRYDDYLQAFFPILSEREKARFWNMIKEDYEFYNAVVLKSVKSAEDKKIGKLYDNAINTKALLLNASIRLRQNILNSGNDELIDDFNNWIFTKETLAGVLTLNSQELLNMGINKDSLIYVVDNLERKLSQQSDTFVELSARKSVTWQNVKEALKDNEVAVEMIRFRHFNHTFTDSIVYAALILRNQKKQDKPEIIVLNEGNNLETKYFNNYRNSIVYKIYDEISYSKYWKPIEDQIGKTSTIYFSPEGIYNQMNLETIPYSDGRYIADNFNIILINNTKDIYLRSTRPSSKPTAGQNQAILYGDPTFYADASQTIEEKKIAPLPGTLAEVEGISQLFQSKGWETNVFLKSAADEVEVKEMVNPKVFHIATHGFYDPTPPSNDQYTINQASAVDNPLLRAGLLLKGAGDIIAKTSHNYNIDDGILTAYEAMNLNLSHTDMVVLSACETGVGALSMGEGVDGLQKAFLVAGAKVLIMSLFKVNDEVTKTLMVNFYNRWLETGEIRTSFAEARNIVRSKHPDPIHWGAFVVFGLE